MRAIAGIIVTGGKDSGDLTSVELICADGTTCTLPSLPAARKSHSQAGMVACGGKGDSGTSTTCDTFSFGTWTSSQALAVARYQMVSWASYPSGVLLMGGGWNDAATWSTELLSSTSSSTTAPFSLTFDTK